MMLANGLHDASAVTKFLSLQTNTSRQNQLTDAEDFFDTIKRQIEIAQLWFVATANYWIGWDAIQVKIFLYFGTKFSPPLFLLVFHPFVCNVRNLAHLSAIDVLKLLIFCTSNLKPKLNPLYLDDCIVACQFSGVMEHWLSRWSTNQWSTPGRFCGRLFYYCAAVPQVECIASVPIHTNRICACEV